MTMLVALITALLVAPQSVQPAGRADRDAIYRAVLQDARCNPKGRPGTEGGRPVLLGEVVNPREQSWWEYAPPPSLVDRLPKTIPGLRAELLQEYLRINASPSRFTDTDARNMGADILTRSEVEQLGKEKWFWTALFERFPSASALIELSAPAIDRSAGEALVYCSESTNALSGRGFLVMLRHGDQGWVPVFWQEMWVS